MGTIIARESWAAMNTLNTEHFAHLSGFRITPEILEEAQVASISDSRFRSDYGFNGAQDLSGILFPYFNSKLERIGARIRLDHPTEDGAKYLSERSNQHLFVPPACHSFAGNVSIPIVLVESEKAALAMYAFSKRTNREWLPIAVGGCWGWKRKIGKKTKPDGGTEPVTGPSPDFDKFEFKDRVVFVAFDSNVGSNKLVRLGRKQLARELRGRNARVSSVDIPQHENVNGPDDLIKFCGDEALEKALREATPSDRGDAIFVREGEYPEALDQAEEVLVTGYSD